MHSPFQITYAAHTNACTFLLDAEGICRRIVLSPSLGRTQKGREAASAANRCIGAQYVASLDAGLPGILSEMPRVGIPMVFACVDERGRVSLVRTGVVRRFENAQADDPFFDRPPSVSVETSAPALPPAPPSKPFRLVRAEQANDDFEDETIEREPVRQPKSDRRPTGGVVVDLAGPTTRRAPRVVPPEPRQSETQLQRRLPRIEVPPPPRSATVLPSADRRSGER